MPTLRVSTLHISASVAEKITEKHGLDPEVVRSKLEGVGGVAFRWDDDPVRGNRAIVVIAVNAEAVQAVLYPSRTGDAEEWHLGSAYPVR